MSKMISRILCCLLMMPFFCLAQADISGEIVDKADGKPIPGATVFLNGATTGTITTKEGSFALQGVKKGQYDLVVSCIGYANYYQQIVVGNSSLTLPTIQLEAKATALQEVRIEATDPRRDWDIKQFLAEFLGGSANAASCKLLNPDALDISYDFNTSILTASSSNFLEITNKALGYKIYYKLTRFSNNYISRMLTYEGLVRFEELKGKASERKRWAKNRQRVYLGSSMNFLRAAFQSRVSQEGFKVFRLIRKPNPNRPPDSLLRKQINTYIIKVKGQPELRDSLSFYNHLWTLPKFTELLITTPMTEENYIQQTDNNSLMKLKFSDNLYVLYSNKDKQTIDLKHVNDAFNKDGTVISLNNKQAVFDANGIYSNSADVTIDGTWSLSGVADMLPVDYIP